MCVCVCVCVRVCALDPFTIITREAGAGGLSLGIEGPSKAVIDFQDKRDGTSDVNYTVTQPGEPASYCPAINCYQSSQ